MTHFANLQARYGAEAANYIIYANLFESLEGLAGRSSTPKEEKWRQELRPVVKILL